MPELPSEMVEAAAKAYFMHYGVWLSISQIKAILQAAHVPELLDALRFYAEGHHYGIDYLAGDEVVYDRGAKARAVLERVGVRV